ncbi:metallophosphoesterase [Nakamurella lactea]|uniref:metallophosphoesterase n=1 Tax=Nakamurella lactea TaxID=459515 RepID=UPI0004233415|nr:metallophosphoesterase [Nakamurella lactea]
MTAAPNRFSFGLLADCQYADADDYSDEKYQRYFRDSRHRLAAAVREFDTHDLAFIVHLGDLVDRDPADAAVPLNILAAARAPVHQVLGNHDFVAADGGVVDAADLVSRYQMPCRYYSFVVDGWRFVALDSNERGVLAWPPGTPEHDDGTALLAELARAGAENAHPWNGTISAAQRDWLAGEIRAADRAGERVAVLSHHPMDDGLADSMLRGDELAGWLAGQPVVAVGLSGHHHFGHLRTVDDLPLFTAHGMVETTESAFAIVHVRSDQLRVEGFGRQPSFRLPIREPADHAGQ